MSKIKLEILEEKKYYRAKELAKYLGIGLSTVWLYAKQGKLNPKKLSTRVTLFDIDEAINLFNIQKTLYV